MSIRTTIVILLSILILHSITLHPAMSAASPVEKRSQPLASMNNAMPATVIVSLAQRRRGSRRTSSSSGRAAATPTPEVDSAADSPQAPDPNATLLPQPASTPLSIAEPLATPIIMGMAQSSDPSSVVTPSSGTIANQSVRTPNLSMPVILTLLSLILLALIVVVIKLRRQLRAP
jgi:hypothetical protein